VLGMRALCILVLQYMHIATATVPLHALPLFYVPMTYTLIFI